MKLRRTISTILAIVLFSSVSLFMGCSDDDDDNSQTFDFSQLYAEKLIIDDGALELEGDHSKLTEQAQQSGGDIVISGTGTGTGTGESIRLTIKGLPSDVHTVEVVKSVDTHHVEIETEGDVISVKIFLTADDDRCVTYNLNFSLTV
ncbi:MAG: hypothetical protein GY795_42735 [Desulfobacterales bacterium]|nr:hypothetical protein [Desulfobacterales bacterium]